MLTYSVKNKETTLNGFSLTMYTQAMTLFSKSHWIFSMIVVKKDPNGENFLNIDFGFFFIDKEKKKNLLCYYLGQCLFEYNLYYWSVRNDGDIGNRWIRFNEIAGCKTKERERGRG